MRQYSLLGAFVLLAAICLPDVAFSQCIDWYRDADGDGFGTVATTQSSCVPVAGYVTNKLDCNDNSVNAPEWQRFGPAGFSSLTAFRPQITIAPDGTLYTAYRNLTADITISSIAVKKYNGSTWVTLGTDPVSTSLNMFNPSLAVNSLGELYMAFLDFDNTAGNSENKVTVMKYDATGNTWNLVGARRFSVQTSSSAVMNLTFDANNIPYVAFPAYSTSSPNTFATVMKYDAGNWQTVGAPGFLEIYADEVAIAIGSDNVVYTAMLDVANNSEARVMRYNGTAWQYVGSAGVSDDYVDAAPRIEVDASNVPYVLYYETGSELKLRRLNGTAWQDVGSSSAYSGYTASSASFGIDHFFKPYVFYVDGSFTPARIFVRTLNASNVWIDAGGGIYNALEGTIAIAPDNIPYVAMRDDANAERISVLSVGPKASLPVAPTVTASKSTTCAAESITLDVDGASKLNDATRWVWYSGSCAGTSVGTGVSVAISPSTTTTYYARAEGSCLSVPGVCSNLTVTVNQRPSITTQPAAAPKVCDQGSTTLSVTPGTGFGYQWYRDINDGSGWVAIGSATASSLSLTTVATATNGYKYKVDVRNTATGCITASASSTLTVNANPVISAQPVATRTICEGAGTSFSVTETGGGAYQWERYNGSAWGNMPAETAATLSITGAGTALDNSQYRVTVSNATTTCKTVSTASTLRVNAAPVISLDPQAAAICAGGNTSFNATTAGSNLNYTWEEDRGSGFSAIAAGGVYSITAGGVLTLTAAPAPMNNYRYRLVLSNTGCSSATSAGATLTVNTAPAINTQPASATICDGGTATFTVAAAGTNLNYAWQEDQGSGFAAITTGGVYSIDAGGALTITAAPATMMGYRYRVALSNTGCTSATSNGAAALTVNTAPAITADPADVALCANDATTFTTSASGTNLTYQWQRNTGSGWSDITGATSPNFQITNAATGLNGYQYRIVVSNTGCSPATSGASLLTVNTQPVITGNPANALTCVGADATFDITTNISGLDYQWQVNDGSGWTNLGGSTTVSTLTIPGTTSSLDNNQYRVVASNAGCTPATSSVALLTVNSASGIVSQPLDVTTCELGIASFAVSAVGTNLAYQWQTNDGSGWSDIPGETHAALAMGALDANKDADQYRVRISTDACPDITSAAVVLTVHRIPVVEMPPASMEVCEGGDAEFHVTTSGDGVAWQWQVDDGSGWTDMKGQTDADLLLAAVTSSMNTYAYRLRITTPACEPVMSEAAILTVNAAGSGGCGALPLLISQGVSPNGDNKLDYWVIQGIEEYPTNIVKLYNVWGDLIYETTSYSNELNAWHGESNRGATVGGRGAPDGTYFYLIDLGNDSPALRGFVVLKR